MPIYEYKCSSCGKLFEEWVRSHDTSPQKCPDCGELAPHIVSNTTFVLKGGGWYVTEYGNRKNSETHTPAATGSTGGEAAGEGASSAPATAAPTTSAEAAAAPSGAAAGAGTSTAATGTASAASAA